MASLAFELGFDWDIPPIIGVRDGVFPLQLALVDDDRRVVVSPYDSSVLQAPGQLCFRIYDFTDPATYGDPDLPRPVPNVLQVLFTSATSGGDPFSPVLDKACIPCAQLAAMSFDNEDTPKSVAYIIGDSPVPGWKVRWFLDGSLRDSIALGQSGRFKFRALLTVGIPGQMVSFYRIDPEMVIGDGGP